MTKRYINVAYKDREMAKRLGARWDASVKRWYCPPGSALAKIYSWRKASRGPSPDLSDTLPDVPHIPHTALSGSTQPGGQLSFLA